MNNIVNYLLSIACFTCIYLFHKFLFNGIETTYIIAAFGASAVLVFSNNTIKHAPIKIFLSSILAAFIGVLLNEFDFDLIIKIILAISTCVLVMNLMDISYPPAGAITLIPLLSNSEIQALGYWYILYPITTGLLIIYSFSRLKDKLNTINYGK
ncbi:HPP family protein [Tenacibaculum pacificus]|uniref:HPP family protein n=1 Tax=Tenacibaculum pacificus TaxID=3018314 RepID=UPI0022F3EF4E|nr:HPP family protein [Tenacibaculum pacificus]WBX73173.1 HPP family protein [Tenacibaculum pacificus]